jgi:hypothetical protein
VCQVVSCQAQIIDWPAQLFQHFAFAFIQPKKVNNNAVFCDTILTGSIAGEVWVSIGFTKGDPFLFEIPVQVVAYLLSDSIEEWKENPGLSSPNSVFKGCGIPLQGKGGGMDEHTIIIIPVSHPCTPQRVKI